MEFLGLAVSTIGGLLVGYFVGYAVKKAVKFLMALMGLYILSLLALAYYGIVIFNVDRIWELSSMLAEKLISNFQTPGPDLAALSSIGLYALPAISFLIGFIYGLKAD